MLKNFVFNFLSLFGVTANYPIAGFDASSGVGTLNWDMIATLDDMNFCYFRACLGKNTDSQWQNNYTGSRRIGMPWAGYFVPKFAGDWKVQTDHYLSLLHNAGELSLPPIMDVEDAENPLNKSQTLGWLEKSARRIEDSVGKEVMVYTRKTYWNPHVETGDLFRHRMLIVAQYNSVIPAPNSIPNDWMPDDWTIWQDSNKMAGERFGTTAKLDHNWYRWDDAKFIDMFGVAPYHAPSPIVCEGEPLCMEVVWQGLRIRTAPNKSAPVIGTMDAGEILNVLDVGGDNSWIRHSRGWSNVKDGDYINMKKYEP